MADVLGGLKSLYFSLEDKYYALLDALQKRIPVYAVVDPIDKVLPSFGILLALVVSLVVFVGFSAVGGPSLHVTFTFTDESGSPLSGVAVNLARGSDAPLAATTDDSGQVVYSISPGEYTLTASKEGFKLFSQPLTLSEETSTIFSLQSNVAALKTRNLLIQDSANNVLGLSSSLSITLTFSCQSGTPPASQTVANGSVSILQPGDCLGLSVSVSAPGYVDKTQLIVGDNTVIVLQSEAALEGPSANPITGNVEVYALDNASAGISGAQAKLYKVPAAGSNVLANQSLTDGSGFALFTDVSPGQYVVIISKSGYKQTTSSAFQVDAGSTQTINLTVPTSSSHRKVLVKILSATNQLPISGATVDLHVRTVFGNFILYDSYTSDANGVVNQPLADFNGTTMLVVKAPNFVAEIIPAIGIVSEDEDTPANILLDPQAPANANGTIPNAAIINVHTIDTLNLNISGAEVNLYSPDANGVLVDTITSNSQGIARFAGWPAGDYQATAVTNVAEGLSAQAPAVLGQILQMPITLDVGNALIEVTVKDELNHVLADANVEIVNNASHVVVAAGRTNAQGIVQLGAQTNQTVFVRVSKPNYLSFSSVPFDVLMNNTHHISIEVGLTSATQQVDMALTQIYELTQANGPVLAQTLVPGNTYAFHFSVRSPTQQAAWMAMARVNANTPANQQPSDVGQILGAQAALGGVSFYTTYNPLDEFAPSGQTDSNTASKVSLNQLGDVNMASAWEYIVFVKINPAAVPNMDHLDLRYQSKSSTQTSALFQQSYTIGQPLPAQGDFSFVFFLAEVGTTNQVQVSPALPIVIQKDKHYTLTYAVTNLTSSNYSTATISFGSTTPSTFTAAPPQANLPGFVASATVSGATTLTSTSNCSSSVPYCTTLNVSLANVGTNHAPTSATLHFYTEPQHQLLLTTTPAFLIPAVQQVVQAVVTDNAGNPLTPAQNVQIVGQLEDQSNTPVGSPIVFTGNTFGVFIAAIPASSDGYKVVVTATAAGYLSDVKTIPITTDLALNFSQDFACLTFNPNSVSFQRGAVGALTIQTAGCPEPVSIYTSGFSENGQVIELSVRNGSTSITPSAPLAMNATDSKNLTIVSPAYIGQYPLYVWAKYASESEYSLVRNVDVTVNPLGGSTQCLNLGKYSFNLQNGADAASVVNNCNPGVPDPFLPSATLGVNGVYAHAVPALTTPEMRAASSPLNFNWSVRVDYNASTNTDVNHSDFASGLIVDGNWYRYEVPNPTGFVPEKSFFSGASADLIQDAHLPTSYLETSGPTFPYYNLGPKALLFETTWNVPNAVTIDRVCFATSGINTISVRIDGVVVQSTPYNDCANVPAPLLNKYFAPGPHAIQIFTNDTDAGGYWIVARYTEGSLTAPLSKPAGAGYWLSPLLGIPASNDTQTNGLLTLGPFMGTVTPSLDSHVPWYLYSLTGPMRDIVTNESGIEHLKQAYVQAVSDNPQVRVFLHGADVYAQYIGADSPTGPQTVLMENLGASGEKYGVLSLNDYTTPAGAAPALDVGVLVDASSSMFAQEWENTTVPSLATPNTPYTQSGLCRVLNDLQRELTQQSGATVNVKLFFMSAPKGYHHSPAPNLPCSAYNPVVLPPLPNLSGSLAPFDALTDDKNESWPLAAQVASNDSFWQSPSRTMIIVSDTKPYGIGPGALPNAWKGSAEQELVDAAAATLNSKNIRAVSWYKTPMESTSTSGAGDSSQNDAVEMMDSLAAQTNGFVEAMDFSEFVPSNATPAQHPFDLSANNHFATRLVQNAFDVHTENIVVKLTANPASACVSENGDIGSTGVNAVPKVLFNWSWSNVNQDVCDSKNAPNQDNFRYCDATQFTIALTKKLKALQSAYEPDANASQRAQIPFLTNFDAYLIRDSYNSDFRSDFVDFFVNSSFADAPSYFKSGISGAWKDYIDPGFPNLDFSLDGQQANNLTLPYSGLYRVQITFDWQSDPGTFFVASSPSANIHVHLTRLADAHGLSSYSDFVDMPLDGLVGLDTQAQTFNRDGYGTAFTGGLVDLVQTPTYTLRSYPSQGGVTALNTLNLTTASTFEGLNTQDRGLLVKLDMANAQIVLRPSLPAPVIAEWSSNTFGQGDVYYGILETGTNGQPTPIAHPTSGSTPLAKWTPIASVVQQSTLGCSSASCSICLDGGAHPYAQSAVGDANPVSGACNLRSPLTNTSAFGFTSLSGAPNNAYLSTVFYRPPAGNYSILLGCNDSPTHDIGQLHTLNGTVANQAGSISVLDLGGTGLESQLAPAQTLFGMLDLIGTQWTCVASDAGQTSVYWNAPKLRDFIQSQTSGFGLMSGNACVATGNPLSGTQIWSLNEHVTPLNVNPSNSAQYCGLYNANSTQGYYHQTGIPYPAGTIVNIGNQVSPQTGDTLNALVQYRSAPTGCVPNQSGYPACPGGPGSQNYCTSNTVRVWEGVPNLQP